jgi:hypothetical protein
MGARDDSVPARMETNDFFFSSPCPWLLERQIQCLHTGESTALSAVLELAAGPPARNMEPFRLQVDLDHAGSSFYSPIVSDETPSRYALFART